MSYNNRGGGGGESISLNSSSSSNSISSSSSSSSSSCSNSSSSNSSSTWKDAGCRHITNADMLYGILSSADKQGLRLMSTTDTNKNTTSTSIVSEY
jgi:hypothetical protein